MKWVKVLQLQWHKIVSFIRSLWAHRCKQTDLRSVITSNSYTASRSICSSRSGEILNDQPQVSNSSSAHLITPLRHQLHPPSAPVHTNWEPVWLRERLPTDQAHVSPLSWGESRDAHRLKANSVFSGMEECLSDTPSHHTLWSADVLAWGLESVRTGEQTTHTNRPGNHQ